MEEITKTSNELINNLLDERINKVISRFESTKKIEHNPTKGTGRETIIIDILKDLLPSWAGISTGIAIDRTGRQSPQLDVIVYNKNIIPALFQEVSGFFPVESLIYVIEVKSVINSEEINDAVNKFKKLLELKRKPKNYINTALFGYESDLKQQSELERIITHYPNFTCESNINDIVSVKKGEYFFYKENYIDKTQLQKRTWSGFTHCSEYDAIKMFLMKIINTLYPIHIGEYIYKNQPVNIYSDLIFEKDKKLSEQIDLINGNIPAGLKYVYLDGKLNIEYYKPEYQPYDI